MSIEGGPHRAVERASAYAMTALQVFTRSARTWTAPPLSDEAVERFRDRLRTSSVRAVVAHASYLANPASPDRNLRRRSERALVHELTRCEMLGVPWLILHPGSHKGAGAAGGVRRAGAALRRVLRATAGYRTGLLLENTAGQGDSLGADLSEVGRVLARAGDDARLGACLDTCHAFAAGYDLSTEEGFAELRASLDDEIGLSRVHAVHVNDSKGGCGSRLDRHEGIGRGRIGLAGFRRVLGDPILRTRPFILETPKHGEDGEDLDRRNLRVLHRISAPSSRDSA